jgi:hypothetical protein
MNAKHTPGPWRIWKDMDPKEPRQITGPSQDFICVIDEANTNDDANARLIAAAPELLEAAAELVNAFDSEDCDCTAVLDLIRNGKLRHAIKKAGQQ